MNFETFIARRYLSTKNKPPLVSFLLAISLGAVGLSVFALIFVLSVMNGFERDFRQRILGFKAPVVIVNDKGRDLAPFADAISKIDSRITRVEPFLEGEAVVQTELGATLGARIRGVTAKPDPVRLGKLYESEDFSATSMVMGEGLAQDLHLNPDFVEKVRLIFPLGDVNPNGDLVPRVRRLSLTGVFHSGFYDFDAKYALIPIEEARSLFGDEVRYGLEVWVDPIASAEEVKEKIRKAEALSGVDLQVYSWKDQNEKLFSAMKMERFGMFFLLGMLLFIASLNIFGVISLTVMDKTKDMAIMSAMGLTGNRLRKVFLIKGVVIGLKGAFWGGSLGIGLSVLLQKFPIGLPPTYYLEYLPVLFQWQDTVWVILLMFLMTLAAAFYPARQAGRVSPVEAMRYE